MDPLTIAILTLAVFGLGLFAGVAIESATLRRERESMARSLQTMASLTRYARQNRTNFL